MGPRRRGNNAGVTRRALVSLVVFLVIPGVGLSGCGGDGKSVAAFCSLVKKDNQRLKDIVGTKDAVRKAATMMKELEAEAPSGIKADVKTLSDRFEKTAKGDVSSIARDVVKFQAATKRVVAYTRKECGFDLDAT
jgi:hypothetical protein